MLVFIIPLKSAQLSNSWDYVSRLFERTLSSVCAQTSSDFAVVVVCHELPEIQFSHSSVKYIQGDFPCPSPDSAGFMEKESDKNMKLSLGIEVSKEFSPSHIMFVDADDCVSNKLAAFVKTSLRVSNWLVDKGYEYDSNSKSYYEWKNNFHQKCGTCHILSAETAYDYNLKVLEDEVDHRSFAHQHLQRKLSKLGHHMSPLPFPGAVYITRHGENSWIPSDREYFRRQIEHGNMGYWDWPAFALKKVVKRILSKPLNNAILTEFSLTSI